MRIVSFLFAILAVLGLSCSGLKGFGNPMEPQSAAASGPNFGGSNRSLLGMWDIAISSDRQTAEVAPIKGAEMHLNVVKMLDEKPCKDCLKVGEIVLIAADEIQVPVTLKHPFPGLAKFTGFDVRGIFISKANYAFDPSGRKIAWGSDSPRMMNYDGYTSLFNPTQFPESGSAPPALKYTHGKYATGGDLSSTLNPFVAYMKDAPRRMFEAGGSETRNVIIKAPAGAIHFGYAVDASWCPAGNVVNPLTDFPLSANCPEPYAISVMAGSDLLPESGSQTEVAIKVFSHQPLSTISSVSIYSPLIFPGAISLNLAPNTGEPYSLFTGVITNWLIAPVGTHPILVRATVTCADPNLGQIDAWQVSPVEIRKPKGWARTWGSTGDDDGGSVATDSAGNIYVAGCFQHTVDFDPGPGVDNHSASDNNYAFFLSKFDPSGSFIWARTWGGLPPAEELSPSIAIDSLQNVYVAGGFNGSWDFDPGPGANTHTSNGYDDVFLSKFDSDGNFIWARTWGGSNIDEAHSVAVDGSGNIYVTGNFAGIVDFDPGPDEDDHQANGLCDIFVSKFDSDGNFEWAKSWGSNWNGGPGDTGNSVVTDISGNVYVAGYFNGTADFDPGPGEEIHKVSVWGGAFLSKFKPDGTFLWARTWGANYILLGESVTIFEGNVYVTGYFYQTADFDPGPGVDERTSNNGSPDAFLCMYHIDGTYIWTRTWGGPVGDQGMSVATSGSGSVYVSGFFSGKADFDPGPGVDNHTAHGPNEIFLSKFDSTGNFIWARNWGGPYISYPYFFRHSVAIDAAENAYVSGNFQKTSDFDPGPGIDNRTSNGYNDAFLTMLPPDGKW